MSKLYNETEVITLIDDEVKYHQQRAERFMIAFLVLGIFLGGCIGGIMMGVK